MKHRTTAIVFAAAAAVILLVALLRSPAAVELRIRLFVRTHETELAGIAAARLEGASEPASCRGVRKIAVWPAAGTEHSIVEFYCTGRGLVPSSRYFGFYWSPGDTPAAFQGTAQVLVPRDGDVWSWSDGTDNGGVTKRIMPGWFFYEAWF